MTDDREQRIAFVARTITAPNAQPRTVTRFRRYATEAVDAIAEYERRVAEEAALEPLAVLTAMILGGPIEHRDWTLRYSATGDPDGAWPSSIELVRPEGTIYETGRSLNVAAQRILDRLEDEQRAVV